MQRGFTIIELTVIVVVISILASIGIMGYNAQQNQANDNEARSMAKIIKAALEKYYTINNEYPGSTSELGGRTDGAPPTGLNYQPASTALNLPVSSLNTNKFKFVPCSGIGCWPNSASRSNIIYVAKADQAEGNGHAYYFETSCYYEVQANLAGVMGTLEYLLAFWSRAQNKWLVARSDHGDVSTSDATNCPFTAL